jgi:hypothetical protein
MADKITIFLPPAINPATPLMRSAVPTDVPPNFKTFMRVILKVFTPPSASGLPAYLYAKEIIYFLIPFHGGGFLANLTNGRRPTGFGGDSLSLPSKNISHYG